MPDPVVRPAVAAIRPVAPAIAVVAKPRGLNSVRHFAIAADRAVAAFAAGCADLAVVAIAGATSLPAPWPVAGAAVTAAPALPPADTLAPPLQA